MDEEVIIKPEGSFTSTLYDQHEREHSNTHTHTETLSSSVHREVTFKVFQGLSESAGEIFVLISGNIFSHVRCFSR